MPEEAFDLAVYTRCDDNHVCPYQFDSKSQVYEKSFQTRKSGDAVCAESTKTHQDTDY